MRLEIELVKDAVPDCAPSVEVAITDASVLSVPYANPDCVASDPPVEVIEPFNVMDDVVTLDGSLVVTDGATTVIAVVVETMLPYDVPAELVAYARM